MMARRRRGSEGLWIVGFVVAMFAAVIGVIVWTFKTFNMSKVGIVLGIAYLFLFGGVLLKIEWIAETPWIAVSFFFGGFIIAKILDMIICSALGNAEHEHDDED
jgi:hypothetical protein